MSILQKLDAIGVKFNDGLQAATTTDELFQYKARFLGKAGELSEGLERLEGRGSGGTSEDWVHVPMSFAQISSKKLRAS